jgi:hypothetical protein
MPEAWYTSHTYSFELLRSKKIKGIQKICNEYSQDETENPLHRWPQGPLDEDNEMVFSFLKHQAVEVMGHLLNHSSLSCLTFS